MKHFIKENWFKLSVIVIILALSGGAFYWFQLRPSEIKKECSWTKKINSATPAQSAITEEDVKNSQLEYKKCLIKGSASENIFGALFCDNLLKIARGPIPSTPEQAYYKEATKNEYDFCIHSKGL